MRTLILDIETSPSVADVWGLFQQNVSLSQLRESTRVICFAAKWHGEKKVMFYSDHHDGHDVMIQKAWELLDEADVVVHYNGTRFDIPHLMREFLLAGLTPPAPFKQVDLLKTVRRVFRFISNKLDHVAGELGLGRKTKHEGHTLWVKCMAGDARAWGRMRTYNKQDVLLTEAAYDRLLPWIPNHPARTLYGVVSPDACPRCGGDDLERRGFACTAVSRFQQYRCRTCGAWTRSGKAEDHVDLRVSAQ